MIPRRRSGSSSTTLSSRRGVAEGVANTKKVGSRHRAADDGRHIAEVTINYVITDEGTSRKWYASIERHPDVAISIPS
ncbi:MAG: hypothetical protein ACLR76_10310 [Alistipes sp.]